MRLTRGASTNTAGHFTVDTGRRHSSHDPNLMVMDDLFGGNSAEGIPQSAVTLDWAIDQARDNAYWERRHAEAQGRLSVTDEYGLGNPDDVGRTCPHIKNVIGQPDLPANWQEAYS